MVGETALHIGQCVGGDDNMGKKTTIQNIRMRIRDFNNSIDGETINSYIDGDINPTKVVTTKIITCLNANIALWEQTMTTYKLERNAFNLKPIADTKALIAKLQTIHMTKADKTKAIDDELDAQIAALKAAAAAAKAKL